MFVKIIPRSQRAKNRVNEHGNRFGVIKEDAWRGVPAILVTALSGRWMGWLDNNECDWEIEDAKTQTKEKEATRLGSGDDAGSHEAWRSWRCPKARAKEEGPSKG